MAKYAVEYALRAPMGGVRLTGGRFQQAFEKNLSFLRGFDPDRMTVLVPGAGGTACGQGPLCLRRRAL